jgi:hypothetical protein
MKKIGISLGNKMDGNRYYAQEKFYLAMRSLASGEGDVRARLTDCYIVLEMIKDTDLPEQYRSTWNRISSTITAKGPLRANISGEVICGSVKNTLYHMKNKTAAKIASDIFEIGWYLNTNI